MSRLAVGEDVPRDQTCRREIAQRAINGSHANLAVYRGPPINLESAGMIRCSLDDFQHYAPLIGEPHAALASQIFQALHPLTSSGRTVWVR